MSTGRKSQLDKFNARASKARGVAHHIQEQNAKAAYDEQNKSIIEKGVDFVKKAGTDVKREDVYAVMTREGMDVFMKMFNNSMENTVLRSMKEQIRPMVQEVVREVIQEEMEAAIKGIFAGMMPQAPQAPVEEEPVKEDVLHGMPLSQRIKMQRNPLVIMRDGEGSVMGRKDDLGLAGVDIDGDMDVMEIKKPKRTGKARISEDVWMAELNDLIRNAETPLPAKDFIQEQSRNRTLYQKFMKNHKGERGAWQAHVESVLGSK